MKLYVTVGAFKGIISDNSTQGNSVYTCLIIRVVTL